MRLDTYDVNLETWPLLTPFRISRGSKTEATVITVTLRVGGVHGRGEGCPYPRYGDDAACALEQLQGAMALVREAPDERTARRRIATALPPGSARNALDCALWDLEAKRTGKPVHTLAGLPPPTHLATCYTISLDTPDAMAADATRHGRCPLLKLKLGDAADDAARIAAVRRARPDARLVVDANEGWGPGDLRPLLAMAAEQHVELIEQPLPAGADAALAGLDTPIPICADESAAPGADLRALADRYQAVNIKLDKTGGLTGAMTAIERARNAGCRIMIGSMVSTSLSMAPAALLGACAGWVDLDSPLLLARDRPDAMTIRDGLLTPPTSALWG